LQAQPEAGITLWMQQGMQFTIDVPDNASTTFLPLCAFLAARRGSCFLGDILALLGVIGLPSSASA
jgi:hypothetical protein